MRFVIPSCVGIQFLRLPQDGSENGNLKMSEETGRAPGLAAHSSWTGYRPHLFTAMVTSWFLVVGKPNL
jgi:hypothetical protein